MADRDDPLDTDVDERELERRHASFGCQALPPPVAPHRPGHLDTRPAHLFIQPGAADELSGQPISDDPHPEAAQRPVAKLESGMAPHRLFVHRPAAGIAAHIRILSHPRVRADVLGPPVP